MHQHPNLSEQELLNDLLNQEKQMVTSYATFLTESSCHNLRKLLSGNLSQTSHDQFQVFEQMRDKGYYHGNDASDQDVIKVKSTYKAMQDEME
jgi:spore coat protein CotF